METTLGQVLAGEEGIRGRVEARVGTGAGQRVGSDSEASAGMDQALSAIGLWGYVTVGAFNFALRVKCTNIVLHFNNCFSAFI